MMYGSSASSRARFTSRAASACWRRDRPVIARERILPRSDRKRFSTSTLVYVISLSAIWIRLRFFGLPVARFERCLIAAKNVPPEEIRRTHSTRRLRTTLRSGAPAETPARRAVAGSAVARRLQHELDGLGLAQALLDRERPPGVEGERERTRRDQRPMPSAAPPPRRREYLRC